MKIEVLPLGVLSANCYMIETDNTALVIDPGIYSDIVKDFLLKNYKKSRAILLTHSHFDHICGAKPLMEATQTDIIIGEKDAEGLFNAKISLAEVVHLNQPIFKADKTVKDNELLKIGDLEIKCIETSGHTPGSMCFLIEKNLFSGDTLFKESIGRTDFPTSSYNDMLISLQKLSKLDEKTAVYPGHGESTTIKHELLFNPFLKATE